MPTMDIISVNIWQILISLCNLLILFAVLKKFLYKPVRAALQKRRQTIDKSYADAENAKNDALAAKADYERRLDGAEDEAQAIISAADEAAKRHGKQIIGDAEQRADELVLGARRQIDAERKTAEAEIRRQISDVSAQIAQKVIEREINSDDQRKMIDEFIGGLDEK